MSKGLGIYIHIPFCRSKCDYCDFYSIAAGEARMDEYQRALISHLTETAPAARGYVVDSVYFGGGTPSFYGEKRLAALMAVLHKKYTLGRNAEVTLECNPDSVTMRGMKRLRRAGFNRVSLGVQSACDAELLSLRRAHTFPAACEAVLAIRAAKIKNLSIDLIYGLPGQTLAGWKHTLAEVLALAPEHVSCYGLKVEPGTQLAARVAAGEGIPDEDAQADMYLAAVGQLTALGYAHYEISNFARPGCRSRHNMKYWMGREYIGFGPGAHSDFGQRRYSFVRDLDSYIAGVLSGGRMIDDDDLIPPRERSAEYLMLRLRTSHGIEEWEYRREHFMNFDPIAARLSEYERLGLAEQIERRWRLTPKGFLLSNRLIGELLELQESATIRTILPALKRRENPMP